MTEIRCPLYEIAQIAPREAAWIEDGLAHVFPSMHVAAREIGLRFQQEFGLKPGDRVVIAADAQWRWLPLLFGIFRAGAVACPLNTRLPEATRKERAQALNPALQIVGETGGPLVQGIPCLRLDSLCDSTLLGARDPAPVMLDLELPATCLFTTGSMGNPRAVVHSLEAHYYSALGSNRHLTLSHRHRWLLSLPLYHVGGMAILFRCLLGGAAVVLPLPGQDLAEAVLEHGITHLSLVPTQLLRLLRHPRAAEVAQRLEVVLLGGGPLPRDLVARALREGFPVRATYGMTETASQITTVSRGAPHAEQRNSDGSVLPHREVRVDADGEIHVRGHILPLGEWRDGSIHPLTGPDGWLATGDLGRMEGNVLTVTGRKDNLFISGGENIQPEEIERALTGVTGATRAVVTPLPDPEFGFRPRAWLDLDPGTFTPDAWNTALREVLPGYMIPVDYQALPPDAGLKPDRKALSRQKG